MLVFIVYVVGLLNPLIEVTATLSILLGVTLLVKYFFLAICAGDEFESALVKKAFAPMKGVGALFTAMLSLYFLVPSQDTAYKMLAVYGAVEVYESVTQSEEVKAKSKKAMQVLDKVMDDYLNNGNKAN